MLDKHIDAIIDKITNIRHTIHQHPELRYEEHETAKLVVQTLQEFGFDKIQTGVGKTGVVALLDSGKPGKTVALRADMDALPITELTNVSYRSLHPGKMHACGHDGHTANLLGCAYVLQQVKTHFSGKIKFIFQPAEEGGAGARAMIEDGVLTNPTPDCIFGFHNWPTHKTGQVGVREGCIFAAADEFNITIHGKGGHASQPHLTIDPVHIGAAVVVELQSIVSRLHAPTDPVVVSVTQFNAGTTFNVVPQVATLCGTIRTVSPVTREKVKAQMQTIAESIAHMYGARASVTYMTGYPPTLNHKVAVDHLKKTIINCMGPEGYFDIATPTMAAEDFSFFLEKIPGCYFLIGNGENCPACHHPEFNFNDEILPKAMKIMSQTAIDYLSTDA